MYIVNMDRKLININVLSRDIKLQYLQYVAASWTFCRLLSCIWKLIQKAFMILSTWHSVFATFPKTTRNFYFAKMASELVRPTKAGKEDCKDDPETTYGR